MQATMNPVYRRRLLGHRIGIALSVLAMAVGLGFLAWILFTLLVNGVGALSGGAVRAGHPGAGQRRRPAQRHRRQPHDGRPVDPGQSTPIGILAGIYLAEYGQNNKFGAVTRFVTDIMLSAPSIVIGLFVYALLRRQASSTSRAMPAPSRCR
jgi:phosphate transport system permease protein